MAEVTPEELHRMIEAAGGWLTVPSGQTITVRGPSLASPDYFTEITIPGNVVIGIHDPEAEAHAAWIKAEAAKEDKR